MLQQKKAHLTVRLFLCLTLSLGLLRSEDKIPEEWIAEAKKYEKQRSNETIVPKYERELVSKIRKLILETEAASFQDYQAEIPETGVPYEMVAIQGGSFRMGSPAEEEHRDIGEGPQREIEISNFWMGKYEVTWEQFSPFGVRTASAITNQNGTPRDPETKEGLVHWVTAPTQPYHSMDHGMGNEDGFPAVNLTHHSASKFCQWLSLQTGHFYRLPTEAEWEYACRAGTTGTYSCPADRLEDFAILDPKFVRTGYEKVGKRKPNPWGLYDMHGNVMEWCLDAYLPGLAHYAAKDPYHKPKQRFARVFRGGSWYDEAKHLRSAARYCSNRDLLAQDPQLPKSLWWLTDADWLGFRIVRPSRIPSEEEMFTIWNSGAMHAQKGDRVFRVE